MFDKNQSIFPSDFHREVWWWAVGLVPPSESLTDKVKLQCTQDILDGCEQWYDYFNKLCEDMYKNAEIYSHASARQYRDILENIASNGEIQGDNIVRNIADWNKEQEKFDKKVPGKLEKCLIALKRTGLKCEYKDNNIIFSSTKYPKIFHAMKTFEQSPNIKKTPARHHFAHCEFRQLFKSYSASYDELLRGVSDESRDIAHSIHDYAKSLKIQRYIHFDTIKYKYKNTRVLHFTVTGNEYPTLRVNMGEYKINPFKSDLEEILNKIKAKKASIDKDTGGV